MEAFARLVVIFFFLLVFLGLGNFGGTALAVFLGAILFASVRYLFDFRRIAVGVLPACILFVSLVPGLIYSRSYFVSLKATGIQAAVILLMTIIAIFGRFDLAGVLRKVGVVALSFNVVAAGILGSAVVSFVGSRGIYSSKNSMGMFMALLFIVYIMSWRGKLIDYINVLIAGVFLLLSRSSTSLVAVLLTFFCLVVIHLFRLLYDSRDDYEKGAIRLISNGFTGLFFIIFLGLFFVSGEASKWLWEVLPNDLLTGRGEIWRVVLRALGGSTHFGIGLGTFWSGGAGAEIFQTSGVLSNPLWLGRLTSADGGYIDVIASSGFFGLCILILVCLWAIRCGIRVWRKSGVPLEVAFVLFAVIHNFSESSFFNGSQVVWLLFLYSVVSLSIRCYCRSLDFSEAVDRSSSRSASAN
jgi:hypothetical protein